MATNSPSFDDLLDHRQRFLRFLERRVGSSEDAECFEPLLDQINPGYADLLRRVDLGEERPVDVAAELGLTANNTMVRLRRARTALRERLIRTCRRCAAHGCLDCSCSPPETS